MAKQTQENAVDQAFGAVRDYIIKNRLVVGDVLPSEVAFAKQLGVSRPILREALGRFRILGIIESKQNVGPIIRSLFPTDPYSTFFPFLEQMGPDMNMRLAELRASIEVGAAPVMIHNRTDEDLKELKKILQALNRTTRSFRRRALETQFHSTLLKSTHNPYIISLVPLVTFFLVSRQGNYMESLPKSLGEEAFGHRKIVEALEKRDLAALERLLKDHSLIYLGMVYDNNLAGKPA